MFVRNKTLTLASAALAAAALASGAARAEDVFKIGLIVPMTGGQASTGKQIDNAIKLYMQQNGDTVAGKKIQVILKDDAALPDNTKRLAQELIVNDKVNVIAGFGVTPAALAGGSRSAHELHAERSRIGLPSAVETSAKSPAARNGRPETYTSAPYTKRPTASVPAVKAP